MAGMRSRATSSMMSGAWAWVTASTPVSSAPSLPSAAAAKARGMSSRARTSSSSTATPSARAATRVASHCGGATGLLMLLRKPARATPGNASFITSTLLPLSSVTKALKPVTLPPGWARLATTPTPSGSPIAAITTGDGRGRLLGGKRGRRAAGDDDVDRQPHQLVGERWEALGAAVGGAILDGDGLPLDIAEFAQPAPEGIEVGGVGGDRDGLKHADAAELPARLRAGRQRPRGRRPAEQRDERAPLHSITSSARASSVGGTSRPSIFAVLRLITSSYLVGAWTGRSAGFSPLRMRST